MATVTTSLYVRETAAQDALGDVVRYLQSQGWTVSASSITPKEATLANAYGYLAELQPASITLDGGTGSAQTAVGEALLATSNYSLAEGEAQVAQAIEGAGGVGAVVGSVEAEANLIAGWALAIVVIVGVAYLAHTYVAAGGRL